MYQIISGSPKEVEEKLNKLAETKIFEIKGMSSCNNSINILVKLLHDEGSSSEELGSSWN